MRYIVTIPCNTTIYFPGTCPFTGRQDLGGRITLSGIGNRFFLPTPWFFYSSYTRTSMRLLVSLSFARSIKKFNVWSVVCIVLGLLSFAGYIALNAYTTSAYNPQPFLVAMVLGFLAAGPLQIRKEYLLRHVRIKVFTERNMTLSFSSEEYAREFAKLNRIICHEDNW